MTGAKLSLGSQEEQDNLLIQQALALDPGEFDRELEPGEKADDAIDFGDLSDGDLAEDEENCTQDEKGRNLMKGDESGDEISPQNINPFKYLFNVFTSSKPPVHGRNKEVQTDDFEAEQPGSNVEDELDYLFSTSLPSSTLAESETRPKECHSCASPIAAEPPQPHGEVEPHRVEGYEQEKSRDPSDKTDESAQQSIDSKGSPTAEPGTLVDMQRKLFAMAGPMANGNSLSFLWPSFKRGTIPKFMQLLPPSSSSYVGAKRPDRIKPVKPTRIKLELADDQAISFKLQSTQTIKTQESAGYNLNTNSTSFNSTGIEDGAREPDLGFESTASELDNEPLGGVSWEHLDFASADWDRFDERPSSQERMEIDDYYSYPLRREDKKAR